MFSISCTHRKSQLLQSHPNLLAGAAPSIHITTLQGALLPKPRQQQAQAPTSQLQALGVQFGSSMGSSIRATQQGLLDAASAGANFTSLSRWELVFVVGSYATCE